MKKLILSIFLSLCSPLLMADGEPQLGLGKLIPKGGDAKKDEKKKETMRERLEKIRNFSEGLYKEDEQFRMEVNQKYAELMREHSDRAFQTNTSPRSEIHIVLEDRFRVFSGLYDNAMIQDLTNRLGQKVAPREPRSKKYAFKLIVDSTPRAEALSTGTIYITTGLVAMLDNTAQLAYVLAHEAGHVAREHWKRRILVQEGEEEYIEAQKAEAERKARRIGLIAGAAGAVLGGLSGNGASGVVAGGLIGGFAANYFANQIMAPKPLHLDWSQSEEDEADEVALQSMIDAKMDVQQVPQLYALLDKAAMKDDRVAMGFWGNRTRMQERLDKVNKFLQANAKTLDQKFNTDPKEFRRLFAELKRDNGIVAYHHDMLETAYSNLTEAVEVREADPVALYYYAKVLKLVGHTDEDRQKANEAFIRAARYDYANHAYGAYLHQAIALIDTGRETEKRQAVEFLDKYVACYQAAMDALNGQRTLPPHMDTIADFASRAGVTKWRYTQRSCDAAKLPPAQDQVLRQVQDVQSAPVPAAVIQPVALEQAKPQAKPAPKKK